MIKHIYTEDGTKLIRTEEAEPECGKDFCDRCGDCLACYQDGCFNGGTWDENAACFWVQYGERAPSPSEKERDGSEDTKGGA